MAVRPAIPPNYLQDADGNGRGSDEPIQRRMRSIHQEVTDQGRLQERRVVCRRSPDVAPVPIEVVDRLRGRGAASVEQPARRLIRESIDCHLRFSRCYLRIACQFRIRQAVRHRG